MVTRAKNKVKGKSKRKPLFTGLTLEEEWLSRKLGGLPTKRIEKQILKKRMEKKKAKAKKNRKRSASW